MPITAALFDLDGTLVDSNEFHVQAWAQAFRDGGHHIAEAAIRGEIGKGGDNLVPSLLPGIDDEAQQALSKREGEIYKSRYLGQVRPFPRARDLLVRTHQAGIRVVLASSAGADDLDHYVDLLDIRDLLHATTSKDDVARSKPAPDIFAAALEKAGALSADALVIGDTPHDIAAASACGIDTIAVLSGGYAEADLRGAIAVYPDVAALLAAFDASPLTR